METMRKTSDLKAYRKNYYQTNKAKLLTKKWCKYCQMHTTSEINHNKSMRHINNFNLGEPSEAEMAEIRELRALSVRFNELSRKIPRQISLNDENNISSCSYIEYDKTKATRYLRPIQL